LRCITTNYVVLTVFVGINVGYFDGLEVGGFVGASLGFDEGAIAGVELHVDGVLVVGGVHVKSACVDFSRR
jgi:hypothetical protein